MALGPGRWEGAWRPRSCVPQLGGVDQCLESDIPCSGMGMVQGGQRAVDLTQLWAQRGLSARLSERRQRCGVRCGVVLRETGGWMERP